ncbi:MAG: TAXI family TRAP transporter solute-binding subunit [Synechococcus sp.]
MQSRIVLPIAIASLSMGLVFGSLALLERNRVFTLKLASGGEQGQYYAFATALAAVVEKHHPKIQIEVLATQGSVQNMQMLEAGQAQLVLAQNDTPATESARAVASLFPEMLHVVAAADSGIETFGDLRTKRVALMPEGSGSYALFWQLAGHYGITPENLDYIPLPPEEADLALLNGEVQALSKVLALGNASMAKFLQSSQASLIEVEQVEALRLTQPLLTQEVFPKGAYSGDPPIPVRDTLAVAVQAVLLAANTVDPQIVNVITQTINQHRSELIALHPVSAAIDLPTSSLNFGVPVHVGAQSYYSQDRPSFLVIYAETIGLIVSVSVLVASSAWQVHQRWLMRQKNRADRYNLEIMALLDKVYSSQSAEQLEELRMQLFDILKQVVEDLDLDRITAESFESFTFPWGIAITAIRHRESVLFGKESPAAIPPTLF